MLLLPLLNACLTTCEPYEPSFLIGKKKQDYVENIMRRVNSVHAAQASSALSQTQPLVVEKLFLADASPIHQFYGKYFNLVDLADSYYWYKVQESHKNDSWKSKLLLGNMRFAMLNAWVVMASQVKYQEWLTFRANLATEVKAYGS